MSEPFIGELQIFAGNFAPRGWAFCDGQILNIANHTALFSLLGTTYGGDGRVTFALPDLRGRVPMHAGHGPGLTSRTWGAKFGSETETLLSTQIPAHTHSYSQEVSEEASHTSNPVGNVLGDRQSIPTYVAGGNVEATGPATTSVGGGLPHSNEQPFLCMYFIIALVGLFPSRS